MLQVLEHSNFSEGNLLDQWVVFALNKFLRTIKIEIMKDNENFHCGQGRTDKLRRGGEY